MERRTRQRDAIRQVFEDAGRPLGPPEVLEAGRVLVPALGIATVYRTISALVDQGWLETVELPGEPARYEVAGLHHHHHFRCRSCDKLFDLEGCPPKLAELTPPGFELEGHDVLLYGRCADCAA